MNSGAQTSPLFVFYAYLKAVYFGAYLLNMVKTVK